MNIFNSSLKGRNTSKKEALELIEKVEKFLDDNGPMMTVQFMASDEFKRLEKEYWPKEFVGPGGELHDEFLALLTKIKTRIDVNSNVVPVSAQNE